MLTGAWAETALLFPLFICSDKEEEKEEKDGIV